MLFLAHFCAQAQGLERPDVWHRRDHGRLSAFCALTQRLDGVRESVALQDIIMGASGRQAMACRSGVDNREVGAQSRAVTGRSIRGRETAGECRALTSSCRPRSRGKCTERRRAGKPEVCRMPWPRSARRRSLGTTCQGHAVPFCLEPSPGRCYNAPP